MDEFLSDRLGGEWVVVEYRPPSTPQIRLDDSLWVDGPTEPASVTLVQAGDSGPQHARWRIAAVDPGQPPIEEVGE